MTTDEERLRRWRLILGGDEADGTGCSLGARDLAIDRSLDALYGASGLGEGEEGRSTSRRGGLGGSAPSVARWLGDIRQFFPSQVVRVMQKDALERLDLRRMLMEPEMLEAVEPDVRLVADLISLSRAMPGKTKETARIVVRRVVEELERRLAEPLRQAVLGSLNRAIRNRRPGTTRSTGTGPSGPTSGTTSRITRRSSPRPASVTGGRSRPCARSSCASTRAARWPPRSSTPGSSAPCSPPCRRSRRTWWSSTRPSWT
jgi:hypothetical protein